MSTYPGIITNYSTTLGHTYMFLFSRGAPDAGIFSVIRLSTSDPRHRNPFKGYVKMCKHSEDRSINYASRLEEHIQDRLDMEGKGLGWRPNNKNLKIS